MVDPEQSLRSFYSDVYAPIKLRTRKKRTRELYVTSLNNFDKFLCRAARISDLNELTVSRYLDWFFNLGRAPASVNKERSNLLAIWNFACRKGVLTIWPDVEAMPVPSRIPRAWTSEQLNALLAACKAQTGTIDSVPACDWWTALHLLCWDTGERISAVTSLKWTDVDARSKWVHVRAEERKGGRDDRLYRLADDTAAVLRAIETPRREMVLPWPYSPTYLWLKYNPILKAAGLPTDRGSKFHRVRRSVASHFEAAGGNATTLLGHSSRKVTECYLDPTIVPQQQAIDLLFRPQ